MQFEQLGEMVLHAIQAALVHTHVLLTRVSPTKQEVQLEDVPSQLKQLVLQGADEVPTTKYPGLLVKQSVLPLASPHSLHP